MARNEQRTVDRVHGQPHSPSIPPDRLPPLARLRLAAEIIATYVYVRRRVAHEELPRLVDRLRAERPHRTRPLVLPDGRRDGLRLGRAVTRTLSALPTDSRCLVRSLVMLRLLVRRHARGVLVIAVMPTDGRTLIAHAWIELDGCPLLDPGEGEFSRLLSL